MRAAVPDLSEEAGRADELMLGAGFRRVVWWDEPDPKALYVMRLGLLAVRVWLRPTGCQLDFGMLNGEEYAFRPWSITIDPTPLAVAAEALAFVATMRYPESPGSCGVE